MDRELAVESRVSERSEPDQPKIWVIVGAPNTGKIDLAMDIINLIPDLVFVDVPGSPYYALGELADYRAELFHALQRYFVQLEHYKAGHDMLLIHSLIDSFAWGLYNVQRRVNNGTVDPEGFDAFMATMIGQIFVDSFGADHIFLIEEHNEDDNEIYEYLERIVMEIDIPHT